MSVVRQLNLATVTKSSRNRGVVMPWIACALFVVAADCHCGAAAEGTAAIQGNRWTATSDNFRVTNRHSAQDARAIAKLCEGWRTALQRQWCEGQCSSWSPRCEIVVHANQASYLVAVGAGAGQTFGSSYIEFSTSKQVQRRQIDFRGDSDRGPATLPHELTHVVLADLLGGQQPPRWADEGMALLADSAGKRQLHERDLQAGLNQRTAFRAVELLNLDAYPHPSRVPAFYGQSLSLTAFLVSREPPARFVAFIRQSSELGYDAALRDCYGIENVQELEVLWHADRVVRSASPAAAIAAQSAGVTLDVSGTP
jgi:hypothetical protein